MVVLAAASPADCFAMAFEAVRLATRYMTPVLILSDSFLANSAEALAIPDPQDLLDLRIAPPPANMPGFAPYQREPQTLARPWATPGTEGLEHRIGGLEKEDITDPADQLRMFIESHLKTTLSFRRSAKLLFDVGLGHLSPQRRKIIVGMRDRYDRIIRRIIRKGIESGVFKPIDEKLAGFMIASMITRSRLWYHPNKGVSVPELVAFISDFSLNGLKKAEAG